MKEELTILDLFYIVWDRKKLLIWIVLLFGGGSLLYVSFATKIYKAECRILPPQQSSSQLGSLMAQMGGFANLVGLSGVSTSGQMMIGVLYGDTILDAVIDQFSLMERYGIDSRLKMRNKVISNLLNATEDAKSGIVTVAVLDEDPVIAAEMANAFVMELKKRLRGLSFGEAAQRRMFFEEQLQQSLEKLGEAEEAMLLYQQRSGIVVLEPQLKALFASMTELRDQIAAKEVEVSSLQTYAKRDNPRLKLAYSQLAAMKNELKKMEEQQVKSGAHPDVRSMDVLPAMSRTPELSLEYQRHLRDLKFATTMYELMLGQLETARLDESKDFMTVQVVDPATPPDYKFKPKRAMIVIFSTLLGLCLALAWIMGEYYLRSLRDAAKREE